jgi:hypothetical protein
MSDRRDGVAVEDRPASPTLTTQPRVYLSAEQLAELTPWTPDAIEKMIRRRVLVCGVHYFQPFGRRGRLLFKWEAIVALIEGQAIPVQAPAVLDAAAPMVPARRTLDVEKATTELQRLLA